jgi:hypothetical protein
MLSPIMALRLPFLVGFFPRYSGLTQYSLKVTLLVTFIAKMHLPVAQSLEPPIPTTQSPMSALFRITDLHVANVQ